MKRHTSITVNKNVEIIIDQDNVHVEELVRSWDTDETQEEFQERIQHRIDWLNTH